MTSPLPHDSARLHGADGVRVTGTAPVAIVAGGSRGLGLLIARELGRRGYRVAIWSRDADALERARRQSSGVDLAAYVCDVSDGDAVEETVRRVEGDLGPVAVAIHVAGVIQVGPFDAMTRQHFADSIDTMLWGPVHLALAVIPAMKQRGFGRFGVITSIGGLVAVPHLVPYSTAKFGAVGLTRGLSAELSGTGVTATTVVPGLMRTGSHLRAMFAGNAAAEYAWFAPGASLPGVSISAERAARKIVDGVLAGRQMVVVGPVGLMGERVHALLPRTTGRLLGLVGRLLPRAAGSAEGDTVEGLEARARLNSQVVEVLTTLGTRAARRNNEMPDNA